MCIKVHNFVQSFVGKGKDWGQVVDKLDFEGDNNLDNSVDNLVFDRFLVDDKQGVLQEIRIFEEVLEMV